MDKEHDSNVRTEEDVSTSCCFSEQLLLFVNFYYFLFKFNLLIGYSFQG